MSELDEIQAFVQVVEAGSVTKAAARLNTAPSAVSRRLKDLETRLGAQLLTRTTRRMALTDQGRTFHERSVRILSDLAEAKAEVSDAQAELTGTLRIAAPVGFGVPHIGPVVAAFMHQHPKIRVDLDLSDRRIDLIEEGVDVAIRIGGELEDSSLMARRLCAVHGVVAASPDYWRATGQPETPSDLNDCTSLCYTNLRAPEVWRYEDPLGKKGIVRTQARLTASNGDLLCNAAIAGLGVIREPTFIVHSAIERGLLEPVFTDHVWQNLSLYALYPQTRFMPARVRRFIDVLVEKFAGVPYWESVLTEGVR